MIKYPGKLCAVHIFTIGGSPEGSVIDVLCVKGEEDNINGWVIKSAGGAGDVMAKKRIRW